ncbi:SDR family oxidoreductase [Micromonospora sp. MS34]|uniref:SDR family oxidoreductase n=1 Tax=Micromonospora sp. MS34 TaxID=3385971 RepID=UPI0039A2E6EB
MDLGIAGRTALVTGATSGLGRAAARSLAAEGCALAICARDAERLDSTAEELSVLSGRPVLTRALDITDSRTLASFVDDTAPQIVVANGGSPPPGPVDAMTLDDYRAAAEASTLPHIGLALAAMPHMRAAGWGRILLVGSETARQPIPRYGLSSTMRPALLGFARSLVHSLGSSGITVNVLAPGYHDTGGLRRSLGDEADDRLADIGRHIPVGRVGDAADFGAVVAFFASTYASFITGTCLLVDGGATKGIG